MNASGCAVMAIYNFLVSQGKNPHLPSLIALVELMNADFALGLLGMIPFDNSTIAFFTDLFEDAVLLITPLLSLTLNFLAVPITNLLITYELLGASWWEALMILASYPIQLAIVTATLQAALITIICSYCWIQTYYFSNYRGIPDILIALGCKIVTKYFSYSSFETNAQNYGFFIITFWNSVSTWEAHTIFARRTYVNVDSFERYNEFKATANFYSLFADSLSDAQTLFIGGSIIKT